MGVSEADFWQMTPRYFNALRKASIEKEQKEWERARYIGYLSMLPHVSSKKRLKITDLGAFPWEDTTPKFDHQTPEELAQIRERHKRALADFKQMRNGISGS